MSSFMQSNKENGQDQYYFVRVMTRTVSIATSQVVTSGPYKVARESFVFSRQFTVTKTFKKTLSEQQQFGQIISILIIPICIALDVVILTFGLSFGSLLLMGIVIFFVCFLFFLLIKSFIWNL